MRGSVALALLLGLVTFAGCIAGEEETPPPPAATGILMLTTTAPGHYDTHPAYGFPTNGRLPVTEDGATRVANPDGTVQWYRPVGVPLPATLSGLTTTAHVEGTSTGGGIAVLGPLAFIGHRTEGPLEIIDISDPTKPQLVAKADGVPVRDADTILYPDGRLVVITTAGGGDQYATDVTDPTNPVMLTAVSTAHGNHNIAVVPGTPIVYNSGGGGMIDIVDYTDPENPVEVGSFQNDRGCHDITFYLDSMKQRAYCAGYGESQIWDISDPKDPKMVIGIPYPGMEQGLPLVPGSTAPDSGATFPLSFSHLAMVNHDASVLIVGDETGGGGINGCDINQQVAGQTASGPIGNLWFYEISDEGAPRLHGHVSPAYTDATPGSCTAHFGRLIEDTGFLVMGFYAAGVTLVDFNDLDNPRIVDRLDQEGSIWDVWYHQGYLFTGDMSRGMDVLTLR